MGLPPVAPKKEQEQEQKQEQVKPFECPVCYTDGADSGLVSPRCMHKICLKCYSTVLLQKGTKANCPCCRAFYLTQEQEQEQELPPAPSIEYLDDMIHQGYHHVGPHIVYSFNNAQAINRINQISHIMQNMIITAQAHQ